MNPTVTVILPIRNEAEYITHTLHSVLAQDYPPELLEVLVVDGQSSDGTPEIVAGLLKGAPVRAQLLKNPGKIAPIGLNIALRRARGDVVIRVDGHCIIAPDYVRRCVEYIQEEGADGVGGPMETIGQTFLSKVIAIGMSSPFGVGNSAFRTVSGKSMLVDTVPFPAYTRQIIERAGYYDEELVRNQDDEYNYRIRKLGGKILLAADVRSTYFSRSSFGHLWRQYFQYGYWKVRVLQKHPLQMSPRQFAPPALVLGLLLSALLPFLPLPASVPGPLTLLSSLLIPLSLILPLLYLLANFSASAVTAAKKGWSFLPLLPLTFAILHLSYGSGFILGLVKFVRRWGDHVGRAPAWTVGRVPGVKPLEPSYAPSLDRPVDAIFKRAFDVTCAALGLLLLSPVFALLSVLIKRDSPGPIFYRGARIGRNGKPFNILKFRSMYELPECYAGPCLTAPGDKRVTPLGRWLRETKLNELPQLWNVLVGEMSLVGPRPELAELARAWPAQARQEVLSLRPGVTSPASVTYRHEEKLFHSSNLMDEYLKSVLPDKLRLDQLYVRNHNLLGDLDVIFMTLAALPPLLRESKFKPETLYNGLLSCFVRRYVSWLAIDSLVAFAAVSAAGLLWRMEGPLELGLPRAIQMAALMALLFSLVNSLRGLGRISWHSARPAYAFDILLSSAVTTLGVAALNWFLPRGGFFPTGMVCVAGVLAFLGFLAVRYRERLLSALAWRLLSRLEGERGLGERVLVVGAGDCGLLACGLLRSSNLSSAFSVAGIVDDDPRKAGMLVDGYRVFGLTRRIPELVAQMDIGVILYAIESIRADEKKRILDLCRRTPARVILVPNLLAAFREQLTRSLPGAVARAASTPSGPGSFGIRRDS